LNAVKHSTETKQTSLAPTIELSFDDVPADPLALRRILSILNDCCIRCEFFVIGNKVRSNEESLRLIRDGGHGVQNHSWSHTRFDRLSAEEIRKELEDTQNAITDAISVPPNKFRAPYGIGSFEDDVKTSIADELERLKLENFRWDIDSEDWRGPNESKSCFFENIRLQILQRFDQNHLVILLHTTRHTANVLPELLQKLQLWKLCIISTANSLNQNTRKNRTSRESALAALTRHREKEYSNILEMVYIKFDRHKRNRETNKTFDVPDVLFNTLIAGEDRRYLSHPGFDLIAIFRAIWRRFLGSRQGASTIPQQLARVLTGRYDRCLSRKLLEIRIAIALTKKYSKRDIATVYLHSAYYGWNMNNLDQAARRLEVNLANCHLQDAARLVARLKYPQPRCPTSERNKQITQRERHLVKIVREAENKKTSPRES
jgi:peptidoglycan/xylan/chitin deacetylase (PgdA/CDA1 family)